ncbi:protein kinase domain-containing protein [Nocardioides sp.]|uniref:serine/threonine-protein kinase n=1 Tax=Nocardioides sp. TaxID=35761 RepID=UPI00286B1128|nr:protein kinase [Nocardioides sp.]
MSGPQIPGYTYLEHLGRGGFADVYLYEQEWPRQRVAVKVVRPDVPLTDREKSLFTAEANAMAQLSDHPYIVSVITAGVTDAASGGRPYLVMRYCPPPDLGVRVRTAPMQVADTIATGVKLASAVETAHRAGIIHRDIKPSNVLVTTYSEPALSDFGIAGHVTDIATESEVRISYPWSPPELLDGRSNGSVASDVYSLGATIWNLLTGRSPFAIPGGDNSPRGLTARILHAPPPLTQRPDVPASLERLLQQCLAKQPEHRPQSALELARALQRIEAEAGYARTAIAVEGDRPAPGIVTPPGDDPDTTHVKPMTVIPSSGPRAARIEAGPPRDEPTRRSTVVWAVAGTAVLAVVGVLLAVNLAGGDDTEAPTTRPSVSSTPLDVAPEAPTRAPTVTGARAGEQVTFTWRSPDPGQAGDSWEWKRTDTGESRRTTDTTLEVAAPDRTCLQVRLIRGSYASPWAEDCVD